MVASLFLTTTYHTLRAIQSLNIQVSDQNIVFLINMDVSRYDVLQDIMTLCLLRHPDQIITLHRCVDLKLHTYIDTLKDQNSQLLEKNTEEVFVSPTFFLVVDQYATSIISVIGIIVNIIGCLQLMAKSEREKMFNWMLSVTLLFDIFFLAFKLMRSLEEICFSVPNGYLWMYYIISNFGVRFSLTSTILMMVAMGHARYQAIQYPMRQRHLSYSVKKRMRELLKYMIPILLLSLVFAYPVLWEIETVPIEVNGNQVTLVPRKIVLNPFYSFFRVVVLNIGLLGVLPFALLIYFSYKIMVCINRRQRIQGTQPSYVIGMNDENSAKISKILVVVMIVFILLNSLRLLAAGGEFLFLFIIPKKNSLALEFGYGVPTWLQVIHPIGELCTVLNATINIIIYRYLKSTVCLRKCPTCIPNCCTNVTSEEIPPETPMTLENPAGDAPDEHELRQLSVEPINIDVVSEVCTFQIRKQGHEWL